MHWEHTPSQSCSRFFSHVQINIIFYGLFINYAEVLASVLTGSVTGVAVGDELADELDPPPPPPFFFCTVACTT